MSTWYIHFDGYVVYGLGPDLVLYVIIPAKYE